MDLSDFLNTLTTTSSGGSSFEFNLDEFLTEQEKAIVSDPYLEILIQPKATGYRFRYASEGESHGGIPGAPSLVNKKKKTFPTIAIRNFCGKARVALFLVSHEEPFHAHFNELVGKDVREGVCVVEVSPESNMEAVFTNVGIEHAKKAEVKERLAKKILMEDEVEVNKDMVLVLENIEEFYKNHSGKDKADGLMKRVDERAQSLEPQIVRICFRAFLQDADGSFTNALPPVYSHPIQDAKAPSCRELKISHLSVARGTAEGGTEITLLCDKVQKKDIEIQFYLENSAGDVAWEDLGIFNMSNIHYQYAIVFKTPAYSDKRIQRSVQVKLRLRRKNSPENFSESFDFTYTPAEYDRYKVGEKRRKIPHFQPTAQPSAPTAGAAGASGADVPFNSFPFNEYVDGTIDQFIADVQFQ